MSIVVCEKVEVMMSFGGQESVKVVHAKVTTMQSTGFDVSKAGSSGGSSKKKETIMVMVW